jgi:hypothetical protein
MKAERRHELQTNELADFLSHGIDKYRNQWPNIVWGGIAIVAILVALSLWTSRSGSSTAHAWEEFDQMSYVDPKVRPKRLKELVERYPNTEVANWARLDLADQLCFEGREKIMLDREIGVTHLKEAQQTYQEVLQSAKVRPEMIRRGAVAQAKCLELMGERDKAIDAYKSAATKYKTMLPDVAEEAARRASDLERPDAADFYRWLAEYKPPTTPTLNLPGLGLPPLDDGKGGSGPGKSSNFPPESDNKETAPETSSSAAPPPANDAPKSQSDEQPPKSVDPN